MDMERWRTESPTLETLTCGCKIVWHPGTHIPPGLLRCPLHRSASKLLLACKASKLYLDWGFGKLGPHAVPPGHPEELLQSAIAEAESEDSPDA